MPILRPIISGINFQKLEQTTVMPELDENNIAGFNLYSCNDEEIEIKNEEEITIGTGVAIPLLNKFNTAIVMTSGYILDNGLIVNKINSNNETEEYKVKVLNLTGKIKTIPYGARLCKIVFYPKFEPRMTEVDVLNDLKDEHNFIDEEVTEEINNKEEVE